MAIYGKLVENYYQGLDFVQEFNQFDLMMESVNNFDIVLEAFSFNDIIEKLKQLWSKFKGWVKEKFKQLKEFIKKILNKNKQMNEEKVEDNKEEKDKEEDKNYIEVKYEYYYLARSSSIFALYNTYKYGAYNEYIKNAHAEKIDNVKDFCKKYNDQSNESLNKEIEKVKEDLTPEKKLRCTKCRGNFNILKYSLQDIKDSCEYMKDYILEISNKIIPGFEENIKRFESNLNTCIDSIKFDQDELKDSNDTIKRFKDDDKKKFEKDLEYYKRLRDTQPGTRGWHFGVLSHGFEKETRDIIKDMSDEQLEEWLKKENQRRQQKHKNSNIDDYYKSSKEQQKLNIKKDAVKINLLKSDIYRLKDAVLTLTNLNMDIGQAMLKNQSVHGKLMKLYKSDKFPENDIEITIE